MSNVRWLIAFVHRILFGIIFALAVAELIFSIDAFVYLQKQHKWWSFTEKARMGFLIFSAARTIFLSAIYAVSHCRKVKNLMNTLHTVSLSQDAHHCGSPVTCRFSMLFVPGSSRHDC